MDPNNLDESYSLLRTATDVWQGTMLQRAFTVGEGTDASPAMVPEVTVAAEPEKAPPKDLIVDTPEQQAARADVEQQTQPKQGLSAVFDALAFPQEATLAGLSGKKAGARMTVQEFIEEKTPGGTQAFMDMVKDKTGLENLGPLLLTLPAVAVTVLVDPLMLAAVPGKAVSELVKQGIKLTKKQQGAFNEAVKLLSEERGSIPLGGKGAGGKEFEKQIMDKMDKEPVKGLSKPQAAAGGEDAPWMLDPNKSGVNAPWVRPRSIVSSERGSVPIGGKAAGAATPKTVTTPTWEEAVQIDDFQRSFDDRLKTFGERLSKQRRAVRSDVQVGLEANQLQQDRLNLEGLLQLEPGTILNDAEVVAVKRMFKDTAEPVRQLAQWVQANPSDQQAFLALLKQIGTVDDSLTKIAGVYAESGRTQRLLRDSLPTGGLIPANSPERIRISDQYLNQWLDFFQQQDELAKIGAPAMTQAKLVDTLARMESPEELLAAAKALDHPSKWDMFMEYWINGLLSGPQTHATNILSNASTLLWSIPERGVASLLSREVRPSEMTAMMGGVTESIGDAWRLAWLAFKRGESQLGLSKLETPRRAITADALELTGGVGRAVDFLGSVVRIPGRALMAADDFFKGIAMRAELRALARREAFQQINEAGLTGATARTRMAEIEARILADPPESVMKDAQEFAAYVTFTKELGETGQKVQAALSTPIGRLVVPFVRTPTNIFKYAGERTPFALASKAVRDEIAAGGARRALALSKISLGSMTMAYFGTLAAEGFVTGGGPKDKRLRQELMLTGWQPYSFKIGNQYIKYGRLEPLGSLIGMAADAADLLGQLDDKDASELAAALTVAISRNVSQKTFVQGLAGTLNAVSSQDINVAKAFFEKELPTLLPAATAMGQTARTLDPVMREVNGILDAFKAKVPGYSDTLPPRRNLWGEPIMLGGGLGPDMISPLYTSQIKDDPVAAELVRLDLPLSLPSKQMDGVPLEPDEYDAYAVLAGAKPIIGDKTMKERLADMMKSDLYQRSTDGPDGGKAVLIRDIVSDYRDMARHILSDDQLSQQWLGRDFPDLRQQLGMAVQEKAQRFNQPALQTR